MSINDFTENLGGSKILRFPHSEVSNILMWCDNFKPHFKCKNNSNDAQNCNKFHLHNLNDSPECGEKGTTGKIVIWKKPLLLVESTVFLHEKKIVLFRIPVLAQNGSPS